MQVLTVKPLLLGKARGHLKIGASIAKSSLKNSEENLSKKSEAKGNIKAYFEIYKSNVDILKIWMKGY